LRTLAKLRADSASLLIQQHRILTDGYRPIMLTHPNYKSKRSSSVPTCGKRRNMNAAWRRSGGHLNSELLQALTNILQGKSRVHCKHSTLVNRLLQTLQPDQHLMVAIFLQYSIRLQEADHCTDEGSR